MKSLILMYVYYDINGDIKAITPHPDLGYSNQFETTTFPVDEVMGFLNAQQNPYDYLVKATLNPDGTSVRKIVKKEVKIISYRSLDNYLTKVKENPKNPIISIRNDTRHKAFSITIKENYTDDSEKEQDDLRSLLMRPELTLYITKHNNPYHLLETIKFHPQTAFTDGVNYNYQKNLTNVSVYTKKAFDSYGYFEEGKKRDI